VTPHHEPGAKPGARKRTFAVMAGDQAMAAEAASVGAPGRLYEDLIRAAGRELIAANTPDSHQNTGWVDDGEPAGSDDRGCWLDESGVENVKSGRSAAAGLSKLNRREGFVTTGGFFNSGNRPARGVDQTDGKCIRHPRTSSNSDGNGSRRTDSYGTVPGTIVGTAIGKLPQPAPPSRSTKVNQPGRFGGRRPNARHPRNPAPNLNVGGYAVRYT
jgi:hypothetical protein